LASAKACTLPGLLLARFTEKTIAENYAVKRKLLAPNRKLQRKLHQNSIKKTTRENHRITGSEASQLTSLKQVVNESIAYSYFYIAFTLT
jgi:hypothetical protein